MDAMDLFALPGLILMAVSLVMFAIQGFAFVDATRHAPEAYPAIDRGKKTGWLIGLGLGVVAHMLFWHPLSILNLVGIVAALIYVLDVRPNLLAITGRAR
jgi:hypothetical protein